MTSHQHITLATLLQIGSTQREIGLWIGSIDDKPYTPIELGAILSGLHITPARKQKLKAQLANYDSAHQKVCSLVDRGGDIILSNDPDFPEALRLASHLHLLWLRGNRSLLQTTMMSIVGTRDASNYSKKALGDIIPPLIGAGYTIVSGGAKGCDRLAHEITLDMGGKTIAVFGTGVDRSYPSDHRGLFERILSSDGLLISQFALETPPEPHQFPMRNEIVALLGAGLLVGEAQESSGSLITARLALEYNKEVFALPGSLYDPLSRGTNSLIRDGQAKLVLTATDILIELGGGHSTEGGITPQIQEHRMVSGPDLPPDLQAIYVHLDRNTGKSIDTLSSESGLSTTVVCDALGELEIEGYIILSSRGYVRS